ncbi:hypothetical protein IE53DRAFT_342529 [Violaceomyces palustris]|uniref:Uncharacterized protein n=1 Tax=Violaceomyces palustris TaxID=1673888 RepID=A0ACD0P035_9BASI|nr:hypothetical protein IE53DRAFT_342529 [Violaceomyces palustris]
MPSDLGQRHQPPLVTISGSVFSYAHTLLGFLAFLSALLIALFLHYEKVVKNGVARYPDEWWPSVSATIGDWYPERNLFQIGIALMSGPRIALVLLSTLLVSLSTPTGSAKASILCFVGILRTLACGGWVFITSTDDHDVHDIAMALYLLLTPPWMYISSGSLAQSSKASNDDGSACKPKDLDSLAAKAKRMRKIASVCFFCCIPPMVVLFYRHQFKRIPGSYTYYAIFEWGLIIFDLLFDSASVYDLSRLEIHVVEAPGLSNSKQEPSGGLIGGAWSKGGKVNAVSTGAWSTVPEGKGFTESGRNTPKGKAREEPSAATGARAAGFISFLSDSYLAFCFWTNLTSLHPMIFFFSVYNMGIGGHELLLISQVIGIGAVLATTPLRKSLIKTIGGVPHVGKLSNKTLASILLLSHVGIASWWIPSALIRLLAEGAANAILAVSLAVQWGLAWENNEMEKEVATWTIGLLLSSLAKYGNHSNNPAWPFLNSTNGGKNALCLALAVLCSLELYCRPGKLAPSSARFRSHESSASSFWSASVGLGALIYALHGYLSDSGTMIAWTWSGYPIKGPTAISHGYLVFASSALSFLVSLAKPSVGLNPLILVLGSISSYVLRFHENWIGFTGAVGMAVFLPPLILPLTTGAMRHHPLKVMLASWLVANLLTFVGVLTVAYAFVPGGKVMRERTGLMLAIQVAFLGLGLLNARWTRASKLSTAPFKEKAKPVSAAGSYTRWSASVLSILVLAAAAVSQYRYVPPSSIVPYHAPERILTAGMWTVHFALDQNMHDSSRRMASIISELELDVFGLVESDLHRSVFGNRDLTQYLAEELGMYADIGPAPSKNTWGAALFSKFPIINSTHHLLPSPHGELAPAIHAVLDIYGKHTHVVVSHNGQEEDPLDRELQTKKIAGILSDAYPHPAIFLGYVVTKAHAERPAPYKILYEDGRIHDVEKTDNMRWCQYLGFRGLERFSYVRVSRYTVTDTEIQTMKLYVPEGELDPDTDVRSMFVAKETYPPTHWYPDRLIDIEAKVYEKHKYSPYQWPIYYASPN